MGYSRRTSNYLERIELSKPTHMVSMANPLVIGMETLRIDSGCSFENEFTELIHMNPNNILSKHDNTRLLMKSKA